MKYVVRKPTGIRCFKFECHNCGAEYYDDTEKHNDIIGESYTESRCPYCGENLLCEVYDVKTITAEHFNDVVIEIIE